MNSPTAPRSRFTKWTDTAHLIVYMGVLAILAIMALVISLASQAKAADVARDQAAASQAQSQLVRDAICGTFVDVAAAPVTSQTTELGRRLIRDTDHGATVAGCPR